MIIKSWEKWRPIGLKGTNNKTLDPQGIDKMAFRPVS